MQESPDRPDIRANVHSPAEALLGSDDVPSEVSALRSPEGVRPAVILVESEDVDGLTGDARPERANSMEAEVAMDDAVRVGVRQLVADVEGDVDSVSDLQRAVVAEDGR